MGQTKREHWESVLAEWESSGLSQKAFCEARKIVYPTFAYWRRHLSRQDAGVPVPVACYEVHPSRRVSQETESFLFHTDGIILPAGKNATVLVQGKLSLIQLESLIHACTTMESRNDEL